jgi:hypothetical protein
MDPYKAILVMASPENVTGVTDDAMVSSHHALSVFGSSAGYRVPCFWRWSDNYFLMEPHHGFRIGSPLSALYLAELAGAGLLACVLIQFLRGA